LGYLLNCGQNEALNLGNGNGLSVREVSETALKITNCDIPLQESNRRPGDPAVLIGSSVKAKEELGWRSAYKTLDFIVATALRWHQKNNYRKG
jgi:UDP-glucose 4-epimerase